MARTATAPGAPTTKLGKAALEVDDRLHRRRRGCAGP